MQTIRKILGWPFKFLALSLLSLGFIVLLIYCAIIGRMEAFGQFIEKLDDEVNEAFKGVK